MDTGRRPLLSLYSKWDIYVLHQGIIVFLLANRTAQSVQIGCDYWNRCCRASLLPGWKFSLMYCNMSVVFPTPLDPLMAIRGLSQWIWFMSSLMIWVLVCASNRSCLINRLSIRWLNEWQIYDLFKIDSKKYMDLLRAKSKTCKYPVVAYFAYWLSKVCININETITL